MLKLFVKHVWSNTGAVQGQYRACANARLENPPALE